MKFLKNNYKIIISIIITILITGGISVFATYNYVASEIGYTKKDGTETNVASALNELYTKSEKKLTYVKKTGILTTSSTTTVTENMTLDPGEYILLGVGRSSEWSPNFVINGTVHAFPATVENAKDYYAIREWNNFEYWTTNDYGSGRGNEVYGMYHITITSQTTLQLGIKGDNANAKGIVGGWSAFVYQ